MPTGIEEKTAEKEDLQEQQLVVFKIAEEEFGVDINEVKEIMRWEDVTRIPNSAAYIKGVINLRGNIIVVNDLAMKLGLPSKEVDDDTRILVVEVKDNTVGMIVDSATEVLRLPGDKIREAPSMVTSNIDNNYIEGVGLLDEKRLLTLLDLTKVLESKDYEKIIQTQHSAEKNIVKKEKTAKPSKEEIKPETPKSEPKPAAEIKEGKTQENKPETKTEKNSAEPEKKADEKLESTVKTPSEEKKAEASVKEPAKTSLKTEETKKK